MELIFLFFELFVDNKRNIFDELASNSKHNNMASSIKKYLLINSVFSGLGSCIILVFSTPLHSLFNISNVYVFPIVGINLIFFSISVAMVGNFFRQNKLYVRIIVSLEVLWVAGSCTIIIS